MEHGVGSPRVPGCGAFLCLAGGEISEDLAEDDVFLGERVRPVEGAEGDVAGGPFADAGDGGEAGDDGRGIVSGFECEISGGVFPCEGNESAGAGGNDAEAGDVIGRDAGDFSGGGGEEKETGLAGGEGFAEGFGEAAGEGGGCFDGDLLAEDGADGGFESIEGSGDAEAGAGFEQGAEEFVFGEVGGDDVGPGGEVELMADFGEKRGEDGEQGAGEADGEGGFFGQMMNADPAGVIADADGAGVGGIGDVLDAGDGAEAEEGEEVFPIVRRTVGEAEDGGFALG